MWENGHGAANPLWYHHELQLSVRAIPPYVWPCSRPTFLPRRRHCCWCRPEPNRRRVPLPPVSIPHPQAVCMREEYGGQHPMCAGAGELWKCMRKVSCIFDLQNHIKLTSLHRPLACGFHHCERLCHADDCGTCTAVCGKSRKSWSVLIIRSTSFHYLTFQSSLPAHHPCTQICHAPAACPETDACLTLVTLTCSCGLLRSSVPCSQTSSTAKLKCTGECDIKKRNARLADALGINPEKRDGMLNKVTYNEDLANFARVNSKFVALVEKTFAE